MKVFKKIIAWAILSIILQIGGLYVLNNVVFKHTSDFQSKPREVKKETTKDIKETKVQKEDKTTNSKEKTSEKKETKTSKVKK